MRGKAIKVIDLLQHSAELGNTEALYTLARLSLVRSLVSHLVSRSWTEQRSHSSLRTSTFPSDPKLAYSSFSTHASLTGNASSQALLAFFHATGYADVVSVDQAKAMFTTLSLHREDTKVHRWHSHTDTGAVSALWKIVLGLWDGTRLLLMKVNFCVVTICSS
jgi:hypothetical protein